MPLIEEMQASGNWLFRWRSYLPLVMAVLLFMGIGHFAYFHARHAESLWPMALQWLQLMPPTR